jgi:hypothetical protein
MATDSLKWLQNWLQEQANGDWEHGHGINIHTVDNPGWWITIDLTDTEYEDMYYDAPTVEVSETDWYFYRFDKQEFTASGDPSKLEFLLDKFREAIEKFDSNRAQDT